MILPGDGIPLTIDAQDDDKSGIEEKHSRSPEEVLKSQCNHKTDIWHVASYVSPPACANRSYINMGYLGMGICQL